MNTNKTEDNQMTTAIVLDSQIKCPSWPRWKLTQICERPQSQPCLHHSHLVCSNSLLPNFIDWHDKFHRQIWFVASAEDCWSSLRGPLQSSREGL